MNNIDELLIILEGIGGKASFDDICNEYQILNDITLSQNHKISIYKTLKENSDKVSFDGSTNIWKINKSLTLKSEHLKAGELALKYINSLANQNLISEDEITQMLDKSGAYGKKYFGIGQFPILSLDRDYKKHGTTCRYYATPIKIKNNDYYFMSQWRDSHIEKLNNWYKSKIKQNGKKLEKLQEFSTSYEAINYITGKNIKAWRKGAYVFNDSYIAWFPHLTQDGEPLNDGWIDELSEDNEIIYEYHKDKKMSSAPINDTKDRVVIATKGPRPPYYFYGVYRFDKQASTADKHIYRKVADTTYISEII